MADHHARHAREREPSDVEGALLADGAAVQAHLHPDAGHADAEVRVVGQQRRAGLGVLAVDDPAVAPPPVGGAVGGRTAAAQERRQPAERLAEARQLRALTGRVRRPLRVAGTALLGVLLEDPVDHRALAHDRPVGLVVVVGVELGHLLRRVVGGHQGPLDLLVEVALEVPRHRLEPRQRVDGRPRLRPVVETAEPQHGVLHRDLRGAVGVEVGVDAGGVGVERRARARCEQRQLLLGDPAPAERADERVDLQGVGPEQLREAAGRLVAPEVHLVEPLLGVHETLRGHQVGRRVGVQLRDAVVVPDDLHLAGEPGDLDRPLDLRKRPAHEHDRGDQAGDEHEHECDHAVRRPARRPRPRPEDLPPRS